jgi:uncharacterized protein involved in exopolysaccharide biosynthesis
MSTSNSRGNRNGDSEALVPAGELLTRALAAYQVEAGPPRLGPEPSGAESSIPLAHYLWVLRRFRWHMFSFVAICTIAAFIISSRMQPMYESTATLDVDRDSPTDVVGTIPTADPPTRMSSSS